MIMKIETSLIKLLPLLLISTISRQVSICTDNPVCQIDSFITGCSSDVFTFSSDQSLTLKGSVILNATSEVGPCVTIISRGALRLQNMTLHASDISIHAGITYQQFENKDSYYSPFSPVPSNYSLTISPNSTLSADGLSPLLNSPTEYYGGSYAANGGSQDATNSQKFYGYSNFSINLYKSSLNEQYGMAGSLGGAKSPGGGRIVLSAAGDLHLEGLISARGSKNNQTANTNGGSGGFIGLDVGNTMYIKGEGRLSVRGGDGMGEGFGGSGGRIVANVHLSDDTGTWDGHYALGGGWSDNCGGDVQVMNINECGGAGTLFNPATLSLQIGAGASTTAKRTPISSLKQGTISTLNINEGAVGCPIKQGTSTEILQADIISIRGQLAQAYGAVDRIALQGKVLTLTGQWIDGSYVRSVNINMTDAIVIDSTQKVLTVGQEAVIKTNGDLTFNKGSIQGASGGQPGKRILIYAKNINMASKDAAISLQKIGIIGQQSINLGGTVMSTESGAFCDIHPQKMDESYLQRQKHQKPWDSSDNIDNLNEYEIVTNQIFQCANITSKNHRQNIPQILASSYRFFFPNDTRPESEWEQTLNMTWTVLAKNYSIFTIAQGKLTIPSQISGGVVGVCGGEVIIPPEGSIQADGLGCPQNRGAGTIKWNSTCAGAGASYANNGGHGGLIYNIEYLKQQAALNNITLQQEQDMYNYLNGRYYCQSRPFIPIKTTPSMPSYYYVGSGGTSSNSTLGGSGGGMILVNAEFKAQINGVISARGSDASVPLGNYPVGAGGGSGGAIFLQTAILEGEGQIEINGGKGSSPGGGGGAGGAFFFLLKDFYNPVTYPENTQNWKNGDPTILGGCGGNATSMIAMGGIGSGGFTQSTPCYKGFELHTCRACAKGTYKDNPTHFDCSPCTHLPQHAEYNTTGWVDPECPYQCQADYNLNSSGACVTSIQLFFERIGGIVFLIVGLIVLFLCIVAIVLCCKLRAQRRKKQRERQAAINESQDSESKNESRVSLIQKSNFIRKQFGVEDLPYHECRIYLFGSNSFTHDSGWALPLQPHPAIRGQIAIDLYEDFVQKVNKEIRWTLGQRMIYVILSLIMPPVGTVYSLRQRASKYEKLKQSVFSRKELFWRNLRMRELSGSVKPSASGDFTLAYLDFMNWDKSRLDWAGVPNVPLTLLFSGNGGFFQPYNLDQSDPLVESLGEMLIRAGGNPRRIDRLAVLLNAHLLCLSFYDIGPFYQRAFLSLVKLIERLNHHYFHPNRYQATLVAFYVLQDQLVLQSINTNNVLTIAQHIGASVRAGRDAKLGMRIDSERAAAAAVINTSASESLARTMSNKDSMETQRYEPSVHSPTIQDDPEEDSFYQRKNSRCTEGCCYSWLFFVSIIRILCFKQYMPLCNKWWIRIFYLLILIIDILLSLVPVLYAFEQGLKMPFIGILFFYPLVPVISIALNIICLIVWHPVFLRVLLCFNAMAALNPLVVLIITALYDNLGEPGEFWLFATAGMLLIKMPLAHVTALHLAWMSFPAYGKYRVGGCVRQDKLTGRKAVKASSQSEQFKAQIREKSGQWALKRH